MLTSSYPAAPDDIAGAFVRDFCRACRNAGLRLEVLCPSVGGRPDAGSEPGIAVRRLSYAWPDRLQFLSRGAGAPETLARAPWLWGPALAFSARLTLELAAHPARYRALVSHWLLPAGLAAVLGTRRVPRAAHVAIAHGSDVHLLGRIPGGAALARRLLQGVHRLAFVSPALADEFLAQLPASEQARFAERHLVQPMGVNVADLRRGSGSAARQRLGLDPTRPVALFLGRLVPVKGPLLGLQAAARLAEWQLVMAGDGPLRSALEGRIAAAGLWGRVHLAGTVTGQAKADLLAAADVLLVPSVRLAGGRRDSLPVAALEALVAGVPVVCTPAAEGLVTWAPTRAAVRVADPQPDALAAALQAALRAGPPPPDQVVRIAQALAWPQVVRRLLAGVASLPPGGLARTSEAKD